MKQNFAAVVAFIFLMVRLPQSEAFGCVSEHRTCRARRIASATPPLLKPTASILKLFSKEEDEEEFMYDPDMPVIIRGSEDDEISDQVWENVDTGEPPQWMIMKELLGINIFTYILAGAIALFLTLNFVLGPGWLGQALGMKGAGTFTDVSSSLPDTIDLNNPDNLL